MLGENYTKPRLLWLLFLFGFQFGNSKSYHPCHFDDRVVQYIADEEANKDLKDWPLNLNLASVNKTHKCYVTCIFILKNLVSTSGEVTLDKYFDSGIIDKISFTPTLTRCRDEFSKETDLCDHVFGMLNCFRQDLLLN
uniref:Odorant-binding protein 57d2 n=1 Tax=Drosophila takahashii TaxID=29030 RepID=B0M2D3_DROTK|nr:odorant-binding protein 57d2 [Drosophila takahashii]